MACLRSPEALFEGQLDAANADDAKAATRRSFESMIKEPKHENKSKE